MGRVSFSEALYLLLTGDLPSASIRRLIDALLVGYIDDCVSTPPAVSSRQATTAGAPVSTAVASGLLAFGGRYGDGVHLARQLLDDGLDRTGSSLLFASAAADMAEHLVQRDRIPPPGFGHIVHTTDPRVIRLL